MLGEHGEKTHAYFVYQSALKVPMIFKLPGQNSRRDIENIAGVIDIVPTVCSLLGIEPEMEFEGADLSSYLMQGRNLDEDRHLYCESITLIAGSIS